MLLSRVVVAAQGGQCQHDVGRPGGVSGVADDLVELLRLGSRSFGFVESPAHEENDSVSLQALLETGQMVGAAGVDDPRFVAGQRLIHFEVLHVRERQLHADLRTEPVVAVLACETHRLLRQHHGLAGVLRGPVRLRKGRQDSRRRLRFSGPTRFSASSSGVIPEARRADQPELQRDQRAVLRPAPDRGSSALRNASTASSSAPCTARCRNS